MKYRLASLCLASLWSLACAQQPASDTAVPNAGPPQVPVEGLVITNARILDGAGGAIAAGAVVVRDGKIVSVSAEVPTVPGALVIDAGGKTLMPGFIDAHRHVIQGDAAQWMAQDAADRMREFLEAGFTTVFSAGDSEKEILELRQKVNSGEILGPRLIASARAQLAAAGGGAAAVRGGARGGGPGRGAGAGRGDPARFDVSRPPLRPTRPAAAIPPEESRARVQAIKDAGFDAVKTAIIVTPGGPEPRTLALIADESDRLGIPTVTHAVTVMDTIAAVEAGVKTLVHTPHIGQLTDAQAQMIAKAGIPMTSTLAIFVPYIGEDNVPIFRDFMPFPWDTFSSAGQGPVNARMLWNAGIVYGYGTDTRYPPRDSLAHELKPLRLVFSPKEIVTILTRNAAINLRRDGELGTLEAGKIADIVMLGGDPLADIDAVLNVEMVIKDGRIVIDKRAK